MSSLTEAEAFAFLGRLFPGGLRDPALLAELCPDGWENSPLCACYHPPPERQYEEHRAFRRNLEWLRGLRKKDESDPPEEQEPEKSYEEFLEEVGHQDPPSGEALVAEPAELLGLCLWDVFSDNHEVIAVDGRLVDLGSFRGSAGMIADFFDRGTAAADEGDWWRDGDYMRFYMGPAMISGRADLTPVYRLIFARLKNFGATWRYSFPRIHVIDFGPREEKETDYNPSAALAKEAERKKRAEEFRRMKKQLDRDTLAAKREARGKEAPATVRLPSPRPPRPAGAGARSDGGIPRLPGRPHRLVALQPQADRQRGLRDQGKPYRAAEGSSPQENAHRVAREEAGRDPAPLSRREDDHRSPPPPPSPFTHPASSG